MVNILFVQVLKPVSGSCDKARNMAFKVLRPFISLVGIIFYISLNN